MDECHSTSEEGTSMYAYGFGPYGLVLIKWINLVDYGPGESEFCSTRGTLHVSR